MSIPFPKERNLGGMRAVVPGDSTISWNSEVTLQILLFTVRLKAIISPGYLEDGHEDDAIPLLDFDMEDLPDMEDSLDEDWLSDLYRHTTPDILPPFPDDTARPRSISPAPTPSPVKLEKPPSLIPQHISSNTVSDYVT